MKSFVHSMIYEVMSLGNQPAIFAFIHQACHSSLQWQNASLRRNNASLQSCSNKDYHCSLSSGLFAHTFVWSKALCRPHCQPLSTPAITWPEKTELLASRRPSHANRNDSTRERLHTRWKPLQTTNQHTEKRRSQQILLLTAELSEFQQSQPNRPLNLSASSHLAFVD